MVSVYNAYMVIVKVQKYIVLLKHNIVIKNTMYLEKIKCIVFLLFIRIRCPMEGRKNLLVDFG